jgi:hypothetical protein
MEKVAQKALKKPRKARTIACQGDKVAVPCRTASHVPMPPNSKASTAPQCYHTQNFPCVHAIMLINIPPISPRDACITCIKLKFQVFNRIRKIWSQGKFSINDSSGYQST